jgi:hypothetical protein
MFLASKIILGEIRGTVKQLSKLMSETDQARAFAMPRDFAI